MNVRHSTAPAVALLAAVLAMVAFNAGAQQEGSYTIAQFQFESGAVLENMKVGYVTWGTRAAGDTNVIVLVPPTSGLKSWANAHIGRGKTFDPDRHFIVSIDSIGGGTSSQPRDGLGSKFPVYNIRDMVRAQHQLLTAGIGIQHALAIGGASSGAYQALEWGVMYPEFARGLLLYAPAAQADRHVKVIVDGIVATLSLDPAFVSGQAVPPGSDAVRRASTVYFPWLGSDKGLDALGSDEELAKAQAGFAENWARSWDAIGLAWRYKSSRLHDVAAPYGGKLAVALARVKAATLVMPVTSDRTHTFEMGETLRRGLTNSRVVWEPLDSVRGHVAVFRPPGTPEGDFVAGRTQDFLQSLR
jgi:homoserine O-acetyltransferase